MIHHISARALETFRFQTRVALRGRQSATSGSARTAPLGSNSPRHRTAVLDSTLACAAELAQRGSARGASVLVEKTGTVAAGAAAALDDPRASAIVLGGRFTRAHRAGGRRSRLAGRRGALRPQGGRQRRAEGPDVPPAGKAAGVAGPSRQDGSDDRPRPLGAYRRHCRQGWPLGTLSMRRVCSIKCGDVMNHESGSLADRCAR